MAKQFNIGSGLINKKQNCFFNAALQALFHVPTISNCLKTDLDNVNKCKIRGCVTCLVINLFGNTQSSKVACSPHGLYGALKKRNVRFAELLNGKHQDAHEFLIVLNQDLEREAHSARWFSNNFTVNLKTHINCGSCDEVHESMAEITDLALHLKGNRSVQAAVDSYFNYDDIEYLCEDCKTLDFVKKKHYILSAPACLCVQLVRFSDRGTKISDSIEISSELSLRKYFLKPQASEWKYKLVAVVNHFGESQNIGHYNTIVLTQNEEYYEFDDRTVRAVSSSMVSGKQAYMLFYELIENYTEANIPTESLGNIRESISVIEKANNGNLPLEQANVGKTRCNVDEYNENHPDIVDRDDYETFPTQNLTENIEVLLEHGRMVEKEQLVGSRSHLQCSDQNNPKISGRRIVDMDFIFKQMNQLTEFKCVKCESGKLIFWKEIRKGLISSFIFKCNSCGREIRFNSCPLYDDNEDLNLSSVLGITAIGLGHYHLQEFLAHLNVPAMSYVTYHKYEQERIQIEYFKLSKELEAEALAEEIRLATENNEVDSAGNALISVEFDGSWEKRSYTNNFSSLAGCAAIIGLRTRKILYSAVKTKYCHICKIAESQNITPRKHDCNRNYDGPSSGMETQIIIDGFKYCAEKGARFNKYVGDGDSSTYKALRDLQLYKDPYVAIEKFECVNHLFRNFFKFFKALLRSAKMSNKGRKLLSLEIGRNICKGIRLAAQYWGKSSVELSEKYFNLERDIMNAFPHYLGIHDNCAKYFCTKTSSPGAIEMVKVLKETGVYYAVLDLCQSYFGSNTKSLVAGLCTNKTEGFNSLIAKSIAGKRICNSLAGSYKMRTKIAHVQYNTGGHSGSKIQEFIFGECVPICKQMEYTRKRKCLKNAIAKKEKPKTYVTDEPPNKKTKKKHYGDGHEDVDKTQSDYDAAKTRFLQRVSENQLNRRNIETETHAQRHSFKWTEVRRLMLTSSYFGRILNVRNRRSYTKIVEDILYHNIQYANTAEVRHQRIYEVEGLSIFTKLYPHDSIRTCGIFIDEKFAFLGATPFRIYGDNGIVIVKCPKKEFQKTMENAVKTISFWTGPYSNRRINNKSQWYFEIQGQLHIAKKQMAYLVIYLGDQNYEVVEIERNDAFWKSEMEKTLCYFYNEALLKELVDSREERGKELRTYDSKEETFQ